MATFRLSPKNLGWTQLNPPPTNANGEFVQWLTNKVEEALNRNPFSSFQVAAFLKDDFFQFLGDTQCEAVLFYFTFNKLGATTTPLAVGITQIPPEYLVEGDLPVMQSSWVVAPKSDVGMNALNLKLTNSPENHTWQLNNVPTAGTVEQWLANQAVTKDFVFHSVRFTTPELLSILVKPGCKKLGIAAVVLERNVLNHPTFPPGIRQTNTLAAVALDEQDNFLLGSQNELLISADSCRPGPPWQNVVPEV